MKQLKPMKNLTGSAVWPGAINLADKNDIDRGRVNRVCCVWTRRPQVSEIIPNAEKILKNNNHI